MIIFSGILTVILVLNCLLLILLVLVQLPKKEAGAGMAFGGAATDALFGAGSGNVLTKVTKYAAIAFFALTLLVALLQGGKSDKSGSALGEAMSKQSATTPPTGGDAPTAPMVTPATTNFSFTSPAAASNAPAATTNALEK